MSMYQTYLETRARRLELQREADALEQQEKDILYELTKSLSFDQAKHLIKEGPFRMKAENKPQPNVEDWGLTLDYVKAGNLDLLQKRLTPTAVQRRWDDGLTIPGIVRVNKWAVTITKE